MDPLPQAAARAIRARKIANEIQRLVFAMLIHDKLKTDTALAKINGVMEALIEALES